MNNQIITTDVIVVENIRDYFSLFYWTKNGGPRQFSVPTIDEKSTYGHRGKPKRTTTAILKNKFNYLLNEQKSKLNKTPVLWSYDQIIQFVEDNIMLNHIPKRYAPKKIRILHSLKKKYRNLEQEKFEHGTGKNKYIEYVGYSFNQVIFYEPIISLIEQKLDSSLSRQVVQVFRSLSKRNGIGFEEYISNWARDLLETSEGDE